MTFTEPPRPVPPPSPEAIGPGLTLLRPQTRKGVGPGLIVLVDDFAAGVDIRNGVPSPLMKWAEEGYNVIEVTSKAWDGFLNPIDECVASLSAPGICEDPGKLGLLCYSEALERRLRTHALPPSAIVAAVLYGDAIDTASENVRIPFLIHSRKELQHKPELSKSYAYPEQASSRFATPYNDDFSYAAEAISHTRNLTFLKRHMEGPYFDLETIWDEHTYYEFEARSVEHTMYTMVAEPYVNHIPTVCLLDKTCINVFVT
jgi:carboxymethylenebutenolidase